MLIGYKAFCCVMCDALPGLLFPLLPPTPPHLPLFTVPLLYQTDFSDSCGGIRIVKTGH
ncbi:hypothetical protein E2C01_076741 [Portunus trituberculatus]|uniref:Uncharacterized protein n=1 Tax=Portunus trituberculatus TaxID=210409 RepID=A0A5B7IJS9_PORTR|nr:hypothetical protein [Portunus trituberculatus]